MKKKDKVIAQKKGKVIAQNKYFAADEKFDNSISDQTGYKKRPYGIADALNKASKESVKRNRVKPSKKV